MLTGELPFRGSTPDLILKHLREAPRPPSAAVPSIPAALDGLVLQLLEKKPEGRPRSAFEVAETLRAFHAARRRAVVAGEESTVHQATRLDLPRPAVTESSLEEGQTSHASLVERWTARLRVFEGLVERAHPDGEPPAWLLEAITDLAAKIDSLEQLVGDLHARASAASSEEDQARSLRLDIGRALDALSADEARVERELASLRPRREAAERRVVEAEGPLRRSVASLRESELRVLDDALVELLRDVGNSATLVADARERLGEVKTEARALGAELDDLRFQIGQLKGRLGGLSAASEVDLDGLREETKVLDRRVHRRLDDVVKRAEPIVRHFMMYPHLRDAVRRTHAR